MLHQQVGRVLTCFDRVLTMPVKLSTTKVYYDIRMSIRVAATEGCSIDTFDITALALVHHLDSYFVFGVVQEGSPPPSFTITHQHWAMKCHLSRGLSSVYQHKLTTLLRKLRRRLEEKE